MTIVGLTKDEFKEVLSKNLTPSATIKTPERLFGRSRSLQQIDRALNSMGRQVLVYGDRGVGKTSVALTAAFLFGSDDASVIYVICAKEDTFESVIQAIGKKSNSAAQNIETPGSTGTYSASLLGVGGSAKRGEPRVPKFELPRSMNDALEIIRYLATKGVEKKIVVIDEMERIGSAAERAKFAEFIKNLPEVDSQDRVKFIFCGIATTVDELIGAHPSAGRILEPIQLLKLHHDDLWRIIGTVADKLHVEVDRNILVRIGQLSDGFPHYVHLVGESMFWSMIDDESAVSTVSKRHYDLGISDALLRAEPTLRSQYEKATMKTKNTEDYGEALWALADTTSNRRQLTEIYEYSYKRLMHKRNGRRMLPKDKFNQRLLVLRKEAHGSVVVGYGSGWFGFRENIIRGYVRLCAEARGVELGKDVP